MPNPPLVRTLAMASLLAGLASLAAPAAAQAPADAWPTRPVTIVVPLSPGASVDIETRLYAQKLGENLPGKTFLVDFKPGAGTTIGGAFVVKSAPDGHTLLSMTPSTAVAPLSYPNLPYDPFRDFTFLSLMSKRPSLFMVTPGLPVKNLTEYVAWGKANPGRLNVGTSGAGGLGELALAWLHQMAGLQVQLVHYKGGAPSYTAIMSGEIQSVLGSPSAMLGNVKNGKARAIAITSPERARILPDLATVAEQGYPSFEYTQWIGIAGPAGIPAPLAARISTELARAARAPEVGQKLADDGTLMVGSTPEQFRQFFQQDHNRWKKVAQDTGVKLAQ